MLVISVKKCASENDMYSRFYHKRLRLTAIKTPEVLFKRKRDFFLLAI